MVEMELFCFINLCYCYRMGMLPGLHTQTSSRSHVSGGIPELLMPRAQTSMATSPTKVEALNNLAGVSRLCSFILSFRSPSSSDKRICLPNNGRRHQVVYVSIKIFCFRFQGYKGDEANCRMLMDDGEHMMPDHKGIMDGIRYRPPEGLACALSLYFGAPR